MSRPTTKQQSILDALDKEQGGTITKNKLVELFGGSYYHNSEFYIGEILKRMVRNGLLERVERGVYRRASSVRLGIQDTALELWGGKEGV